MVLGHGLLCYGGGGGFLVMGLVCYGGGAVVGHGGNGRSWWVCSLSKSWCNGW